MRGTGLLREIIYFSNLSIPTAAFAEYAPAGYQYRVSRASVLQYGHSGSLCLFRSFAPRSLCMRADRIGRRCAVRLFDHARIVVADA